MELITGLLIAVLAVICCTYYFYRKNKQLLKIAGPKGYPIIGNALQFEATRPHETLRKWAQQYKDIMRINLIGEDIVVVNSYEALTEIMVTKSNDYAGRPTTFRGDALFNGESFAFMNMNPKCSYIKKASMTGLKQVGDQVTQLEDILQGYLKELMDAFAKSDGETVDIADELNTFVSQVTYTLVYGRVLEAKERKHFINLTYDVSEIFNPTSEYASLDILPLLRGFWYKNYRKFMQLVHVFTEFSTDQLSITMDQFNGEIRCALDGMIKEMKEPSAERSLQITRRNIAAAGTNVAVAGILTTSSALYYLISLMTVNPDLQEEVYKHIKQAIGDRPPTLNDRFKIPYIESMIFELLRIMSHLPVAIPHQTMKDTSLQGYEIPKGTQIWPNLWHLHHDEKLWDDPWEFKPKRFLDEDGNLVKADHPLRKHLYVFGAGRRVCVAEGLAKYRMFLFIVSIVQKFKFVAPEGEKITTDPREFELGFVCRPNNYNVKIELRQ